MPASTILIYIASAVIGCIVFYHIAKAAVKNGIIEAKKVTKKEQVESFQKELPEASWSPKQLELQKKYEKREISIDEYRKNWDKL